MVKRESERTAGVGRTRCLCCEYGRKAEAMTARKGGMGRGTGEESENEQRARGGGREEWGGRWGMGGQNWVSFGEVVRLFFANFWKIDSPRGLQKRIGRVYFSRRRIAVWGKYLVIFSKMIAKPCQRFTSFLSTFDFNQPRSATNSTETHSSGSLNPERAQEPPGEHPHIKFNFSPLPLLPPIPHPHEQQAPSRG